MATKINVRSPFYVKASPTVGTLVSVQMELYIYTGVSTATPSSSDLRYTITKTPLDSNNYVVFEISELVRDYIDIEFNGTYTSYSIWVHPKFTITYNYISGQATETPTPINYIALDGYGYFTDSINPELQRDALQSNLIIYKDENEDVILPIFAEDTNTVKYYQDATLRHTVTITDNGNTNQKIQYISSSVVTGTFNKIVVNYGSGAGTDRTINIEELQCSKYTPVKATFVNKFGALQDIYLDRKSAESISTKSETYKSSSLDLSTLTYDVNKHQKQTFDKLGNETIIANTGYIDESFNEVIKQLMLSEQVWLEKLDGTGDAFPVNVTTQSLQYKTSVNDKLVQYTLNFEYAFDKINNVR